jgi:hypothetical protein
MSDVCLNFNISDNEDTAKLRDAIASEFFFSNYSIFLDAAIEEGKTDLQLAETVDSTARLSFAVADIFMAHRNHVTGTTEGEEYDYV